MKNTERSARAEMVLYSYGPPREPNLRDLLADLMHYAAENKIDFAYELENAEMHFQAETENEE